MYLYSVAFNWKVHFRYYVGLRHCSDHDDAADPVCVGAGSTPTVIYANPPLPIRSRKSPAEPEAAAMMVTGPPTGPLPPIPSRTFSNNQVISRSNWI